MGIGSVQNKVSFGNGNKPFAEDPVKMFDVPRTSVQKDPELLAELRSRTAAKRQASMSSKEARQIVQTVNTALSGPHGQPPRESFIKRITRIFRR